MRTETRTEPNRDLVKELNELIEVDFDAVAAYEQAIKRVDESSLKQQLTQFMGDHERHIRELTECVSTLGGSPARKGDAKKILTQGKVILADLAGDRAILKAMKSNEDQTVARYEKAVKEYRTNAPVNVRMVLERGLADEQRHREWFKQASERN